MSIIQEMKAAFSERFEITRYIVQIGSRISVEWDGQQVDAKAIVTCEGSGSNDELIELLCCFVDGNPDSFRPSVNPSKRAAVIYFRFEHLPIFLDILRNEKPVFGYVNEKHPNSTKIVTSIEPIGEAE